MKCTVCGAKLRAARSDLPFKVSTQTIVILKNLPVLECEHCAQYLIEDQVFSRVEELLGGVNGATELEIIRYAA
jgi:YgiT-type zinc finger domain-containing protein